MANMSLAEGLRRYGTLLALLVICVLLALTTPRFLTVSNLSTVLVQLSMLVVVASGLTVVVASGEFDLSVGAVAGLAGVLTTGLLAHLGTDVGPAVGAGVAVGAVVGLLNGILVAVVGLPSLIATLGMISVVTGLNQWYTQGQAVYGGLPDSFAVLGRGALFGIPVPILIMLAIVVISYILLERSATGRHLYTIGDNKDVARLAGISVRWNKIFALVFCGACAGLAGVIMASRLGSGQPAAGDHFLMDGLAAVFLGMTAFSLGQANLRGTVVGALIIGVLRNGFNLLGWPYYIQDIAMGVIMIGAITVAASKGAVRMPSVTAMFK
ncbi:ABC transporter permease [Mesorhizobium sp. Root552]|uniref:ABC transporter permease n=1 Tax=Mesorhizobium sp. Root552 TaxID=1736555 RepID=UPI00138F6271|nr:ABC transporter permease [Mesorhizobium sp. Root552]